MFSETRASPVIFERDLPFYAGHRDPQRWTIGELVNFSEREGWKLMNTRIMRAQDASFTAPTSACQLRPPR